MKKCLAFLMAALLLLSLSACAAEKDPAPAGEGTSTAPQTTESSEPAPQTTESSEPVPQTTAPAEEDQKMGTFENGVYTNSFLGIRCDMGEGWLAYDREQLAQLSGITADALDDEALAEALRSSGVAFLLYASSNDLASIMNITLEDLGFLYGAVLDEQSYAELSVDQLPAALESAGLTKVTAEIGTVTLAGKERTAVLVHGLIGEMDVYEVVVCVKVDSYMAAVTVGSYYRDITSDLLALFSPLDA